MKKTPESTKQWADESFLALKVAWKLLKDHYPTLLDNEKIELIGYAPDLAAMYRDINDEDEINEALKAVCLTLANELKHINEGEQLDYSIHFLLSYLESNMMFGFISEADLETIMDYLCQNYDIQDSA